MRRNSDALLGQVPVKVVDGADRVRVERDQNVALLHARAVGRTVRLDGDDQDAALAGQVELARGPPRQSYGLTAKAQVAAPDLAVLHQFARDEFRRVDPYSEAE